MIWKVPRIWEGGDVWILGGGPSVPRQFNVPDSVIQDVSSGKLPPSEYSKYMEELHDRHVIGINAAYLIGDWIDMIFFGDVGFFLDHQERLAKHPGVKASCHPRANNIDWIRYLPRNTKHSRGISTDPSCVCWNGNSGAAAISIAVNAGASRIILLGFDMKLSNDNYQWWHQAYHRSNKVDIKDQKRLKNLPFNRHLVAFPYIAKDAKECGVEILNACPDSAIKDFPRFTVKELLWDNS